MHAINYFVAEKYVSALKDIAAAPNQRTLILPFEASATLGSLAGIAEIARDAFGGPRPGSGGGGGGGGGGHDGPPAPPRGPGPRAIEEALEGWRGAAETPGSRPDDTPADDAPDTGRSTASASAVPATHTRAQRARSFSERAEALAARLAREA
ncbi:MAG: hypothetical protein AcusKO_35970 [Acuticoccus sp.]